MDEEKKKLADHLEELAAGVRAGVIHAVLTVAITDTGTSQLVLVDRDHREALISAINEEMSRMLDGAHHLVSTDKLKRFLAEHNITDAALLDFDDRDSTAVNAENR